MYYCPYAGYVCFIVCHQFGYSISVQLYNVTVVVSSGSRREEGARAAEAEVEQFLEQVLIFNNHIIFIYEKENEESRIINIK